MRVRFAPTSGSAARPVRLVRRLLHECVDDRVSGLAAEVAFFSVLSVFPGLLVLAAALGSLEALVGNNLAREAEELVLGFLNRILTTQAAGAVQAVQELFTRPRGGLITFASLFGLYGLSRGFAAVIRALDLAYDLDERRSLVHQRLTALLLALTALITGIVLLATIVVGPLLGGGRALAEVVGLAGWFSAAWAWLRWPFAFVLLVVWAVVLYRVAPYQRTRLRDGLPGAVLAALLWLAVSAGFSLYLRLAVSANPVLGALGGALILLVWLYLLALALLVGGELNAILAARPRGAGSPPA
ncbi:MAG TPA: YihY/virulence factor BrkB family protein [Actinomycetes bacterium]|jgi:membrane protein|nr:YihY/virulence factor BrkB family protein [Actinomycetes bacterium]